MLERITSSAKQDPKRIILAEGEDERVQRAATQATQDGLATLTLLGNRESIERSVRHDTGNLPVFEIVDPSFDEDAETLAGALHRLRKHKGMSLEEAKNQVRSPIVNAAIRVQLGMADGTVAGAVATTSDTIRASLQIIGRADGVTSVSSFFLMTPDAAHPVLDESMIFADCGLLVDPDRDELVAIALASADSCQSLLGEPARIALLSYSTAGSATHPSLEKIREAVELIRAARPDLEIDGELQFDAAFDAVVRKQKAPNSQLTGRPNVFVFPNLASGNIGYKIAQRIGGLAATGPILQGLAKPANDLSRGCNVDEIVAAIAVTGVQAANLPSQRH